MSETPEEILKKQIREMCDDSEHLGDIMSRTDTYAQELIKALKTHGYVIERDWQTIESAPKDGDVLCYDDEWSDHGVAIAEDYNRFWQVTDRDDNTEHFTPTHWKPLPTTPNKENE